jgi:hypothetical protein
MLNHIYTFAKIVKITANTYYSRKSTSEYKSKVTVYKSESCDNSLHKLKYTNIKKVRTMQAFKTLVENVKYPLKILQLKSD